MNLKATAQARAYTAGWAVGPRVPARVAYPAADRAARLVVSRGGKGVDQLRRNYARVRPELDDAALDALVLAGMRSYLRYYVDVFRLPGWPAADVARSVRTVGMEAPAAELAAGRGVIMALAHQGNWDLAGTWAHDALGPIVTVAERLEPPEAFEAFLKFRTDRGMEILSLGDDGVFATLVRRVREGFVVPLLMDRDLSRNGVEVQLAGHPARMAKGPGLLADLTGQALFPVSITYERVPAGEADVAGSGYRTVVTFHPAVPRPDAASREERVAGFTQGCADALGGMIRSHTEDWHMLQVVFTADMDPTRVRTAGS